MNLIKFQGLLPYASELFGIYQPLVGWKSRLIQNRLTSPGVQVPGFPKIFAVELQPRRMSDADPFYRPGVFYDAYLWLNEFGGYFVKGMSGSAIKFQLEHGAIVTDPEQPADFFTRTQFRTEFDTPPHVDGLLVRWLQLEAGELLVDHPANDTAFWSGHWSTRLTRENLNKLLPEAWTVATSPPRLHPPGHPEVAFEPYAFNRYLTETVERFADKAAAHEFILNREVYVARYLASLVPAPGQDARETNFPNNVNALLLKAIPPIDLRKLLEMLDPLYLAKGAGRDAVLSPIGIVHVFRQYFFEFQNFLGPSVEHIWLTPGSTTELIEVSTRRTLQERTIEEFAEAIQRTESSTTNQDELSRAIKEENQRNTKLGSSVTGGASILIAHVEGSASMSIDETQRVAREETHRATRQQSAKLSSEIRNNFKSTFRTVTEVTDVRSRRYVIENKTPELINIELRRKVRQVGVQMQDVGTYLCWQTYVDEPGEHLGVSQMVHLASKADLSQFGHVPYKPVPDAKGIAQTLTLVLPVPKPGQRSNLAPIYAAAAGFVVNSIPGAIVAVSAVQVLEELFGDSDDKGSNYDIDHPTKHIRQPFKIAMPEGYEIAPAAQIEDDGDGPFKKRNGAIPVRWRHNAGALQGDPYYMNILNGSDGTLELVISGGGVTPGEMIEFEARVVAMPTAALVTAITTENTKIAEENQKKDVERERRIKEEFVKSVKERVKLASEIRSRDHAELREEERTVIYRQLISRLMRECWTLNSDRKVAHLRSELIKAIFDVDKMLYFVAPEWWQPRRHAGLDVGADRTTSPLLESLTRGSLAVVQKDSSIKKVAEELVAKKRLGTLGSEDIVGWGGEGRRDNYLITDDSAPAKLGSSLGWLLQLDGDNLRNAFLNAPWVKAVIPVRPGREKEALEWLKQSQVEGTEGLSERYAGDDDLLLRRRYAEQHNLAAIPASITIDQAIEVVATDVAQKFKKSNIVTKEVVEVTPGQEEDIFYLPPDEVFEKGFRPLVGGFQATLDEEADKRHFKIFDQWIELLPTDQIVAVKVKYNADGVQVPIDDDHEADDDDT